jgi:HEAT repeat protein
VVSCTMADGETIDIAMASMITDYMERGFLENIVDMFIHDSGLYQLIGELIQDERVRVRVGITALMEDLKVKDGRNIARALPGLLPLLIHDNPVARGDAANLIGIIGDERALPLLEKLLTDENPNVRIIAEEAIEEIRRR